MKEKFTIFLKWLIDNLLNFYTKLNKDNSISDLPFHSLSPIKNADKDNNYSKALKWAIENRKKEDIKNIAIAGPFGSGKSSMLKTFEENNTNRKLHILNISLANFKNGKLDDDIQKPDLPRLIELSILQQIFYHEKDSKIPDSRFRKIRSFKPFDLIIKSAGALIFLFAFSNIFFHEKLVDLCKKLEISFPVKDWLTVSSIIALLVGVSFLIYNSVRAIHSLRVSKLKIKNAEIEVDKDVNKSILNHHLDEILYFFEVTKYNVVVIEDLDRFGQTEIFTKLREINLLINNSKKIKKDVVFIYAIRDDMFLDEERTKFFDFVIPIIPVINSSNSNEILLEKKKEYNFNISDNLIDNISMFIDDMRILHNIINEYYIYHLKLNDKLDQNKLLSMIVYKNMFPNDFTELAKNAGELFKSLSQKKHYLKLETKKIDEQIENNEKEIRDMESLKIKDISELRAVYLFRYQSKLNQLGSFVVDNVDVPIINMLENDNFYTLADGEVAQVNVYHPSYRRFQRQNLSFDFDTVSNEIDENLSYYEREEKIVHWTKNHVNKLKKRIEDLEIKKVEIKSLPIKKIFTPINSESESNNKQQLLINILLRNGFIDEDYLDYISIFYEGSLSKKDHQFLLNVKAQISQDFDYNLIKLEKLVNKINENDFKEPYILNYKLVSFLLKNGKFNIQRANVFQQLSNESKKSIGFIDGFIQNEPNIPVFIKTLCNNWGNIWNYISAFSNFTEEKKNKYLRLILLNANISDLKNIADNSDLRQLIELKADFGEFINDDVRAKEIIKNLGIKFERLDISKNSDEIVDFIYTGYYFAFNREIFKILITKIGTLNSNEFEVSNYNAIKEAGCDLLLDYINTHVNDYILEVYLKISTNKNEKEDSLIELLNNSELSSKNRIKLIEFVDTKITDISRIENSSIWSKLFDSARIVSKWSNILHYYLYKEKELDEHVFKFLNEEANAVELSNEKIPNDYDNSEDSNKPYWNLTISLIKSNDINDKSYEHILKSVPHIFSRLSFEDLSHRKVELLIQKFIISSSSDNYDLLKENFTDLHIKLLTRYKTSFLKAVSEYKIDKIDFYKLISSKDFNSKEKEIILNNIDESVVISNDDSIVEIGKLTIGDVSFDVSKTLLKKILLSQYLDTKQKISIFNIKQSQLDSELITDFLNSLDKPYSNITIFGKMPLIEDSIENIRFVEILSSKGYISKYKTEKKGLRISTFRK